MNFEGDAAAAQRAAAVTPPGVDRRAAVIDALSLRPGQHVLDLGTGGGHLARDIARAVGAAGRVIGLDPSPDQLEHARAADGSDAVEWVEGTGDALPVDDETLDGVTSIQVLEYVADLPPLLRDVHRSLRPGGRFVSVSVVWDHWRYHGPDERLNDRIHEAWRAHCHHQRLPLQLPTLLGEHGFGGVHQRSLAFLESSLHEGTYAFFAARILAGFAVAQGVPEDDAAEWARQLEEAAAAGRFGFVSLPVLTSAVRLARD